MTAVASLEPVGGADARRLLAAFLDEIRSLVDGHAPGSAADLGELVPPAGGFFLVREAAGEAVACGGFRRLDVGVCEVKRMYVAPDVRGTGLGRLVLAAIEDAARRAGYARARLDTAEPLRAALALYERAGYRRIPPYNDNPHAAYWLEKTLA